MSNKEYSLPEPRFVKLESFHVVGIEGKSSMKNNRIPQYWETFLPREKEVTSIVKPGTNYGFCFVEEEAETEMNDDTEFTVLIGDAVSDFSNIPNGMVYRKIPAAEYAVFTHKGKFFPDGLPRSYGYIYSKWFPNSQYKADSSFNFEYYEHGRFKGVDVDDTEIDIYVPLIKE